MSVKDKHKTLATGILLVTSFMIVLPDARAQNEKKFIREGNREYNKGNFPDSEIEYRRAADKNSKSPEAAFNIGDALYRQNKYDEAGKLFMQNHNMTDDGAKRSASLYNLGNSLLMANQVKESIDAYKGALRLNPDNMEAKYNLAYAQDLLVQQEQEQEQQKDNQQEKDQQDKQDQQNDQQQNNDNQKDKEQQADQQQNATGEQQISKEDAERLLNALANDEKNIQEKVKQAKAAKARVRTVKNW